MGAFDLFLEPSGRFTFQGLHDVRDRVTWRGEKTKVNVVLLDVQLNDFPVFPLADGLEYPFQFTFDLLCPEDLASVLWRPYQVVFQVVKTV